MMLQKRLFLLVLIIVCFGNTQVPAISSSEPASAELMSEIDFRTPESPTGWIQMDGHPRRANRDIPLTWFGHVDPDGNAVEGECWTFDHGDADPLEGWTEVIEPELTAWRQIDAASWSGHDNPEPEPIITGTGSAWAGLFQDEADALGWVDGIGYGNEWAYRFQSPTFTWDGANPVYLSFNYWLNLEDYCDYLHIYLRGATSGVEIELDALSGVQGDHDSPAAFYTAIDGYLFTSLGENDACLVFELTSDAGWSDEDGMWPTAYGPFAMDDIALTNGVADGDLLYTFDTGDDGFSAISANPAVTFCGVAPVTDYNIPCESSYLSENVLHLHDDSQGHPEGQYTTLISPPATLPEAGCFVFAEMDVLIELAYGGVFYRFGWMYTLDGINWSDRVGNYMYLYNPGPICSKIYSSAAGYVPENALAVKFVIELISDCDSFGIPPQNCTIPGNATPLFDNIRIGALSPGVLRVPSTEYATIQAAIDGSDPQHTEIVVWGGVHAGAGNTFLHFESKTHPVHIYAVSGPEVSIIEGDETYSIGVNMTTDYELAEVLMDGFTFRGFDSVALYHDDSPRPLQVVNCIIHDNSMGIDFRDGALSMSDCLVHGNLSGCALIDCAATVSGCTL